MAHVADTPQSPPPQARPWTLRARWVFPVERPPLPGGLITVRGEFIEAVDTAGKRTPDVDLGNVAILPGLVNAHTHLDLSDARGMCPPGPDFTQWLRQVIAHRRRQTPDQVQQAIRNGIDASLRAGVTLLGDIAATRASWPALAAAPLRAVVFHELLGLSTDRATQAQREAVRWLADRPDTSTLRPGISPHAPYSVARDLFAWVGAVPDVPIATHLAETAQERALLENHAGPFLDFLRELGVWAPDQLAHDWNDVLALTGSARLLLYVHANHISAETPLPRHATVVYCPRTHSAFGHPPHPFRELLRRGVRVALGTDSLASNPDLDLLAEMRFVHQHYPDVPSATLVRMATLSGAESLGWDDVAGSLTPGKSADLIVLPLPDRDADPHELVLDSDSCVERVLWRGNWRW
jgi:cytosine/adenosine deaminase-related metal-dependent hydrolase